MRDCLTIILLLEKQKNYNSILKNLDNNLGTEINVVVYGSEVEITKYRGKFSRIRFLSYESIEYDESLKIIDDLNSSYVYFADYDIKIDIDSIKELFYKAIESKADIGLGNCFNTRTGLNLPCGNVQEGVITLESCPELIKDTIMYNKIFSVEFLKKLQFDVKFSNKHPYTRIEFVTKALINAQKICYRDLLISLWNQSAPVIDDETVSERLLLIENLQKFYRDNTDIRTSYLLKEILLERDITFVINAIKVENCLKHIDRISKLLKQYTLEDFSKLDVYNRLLCYLAKEEMWDDFIQVKNLYVSTGSLEGNRIISDMKYLLSNSIPEEIFDLTSECSLIINLEKVGCFPNALYLKGSACIESLYMTNYSNVKSELVFVCKKNIIRKFDLENRDDCDFSTFPLSKPYNYFYFDEKLDITDIALENVQIYLRMTIIENIVKEKYLFSLTKEKDKWEVVIDGNYDEGFNVYNQHLPSYIGSMIEKSRINKEYYTIIGLFKPKSKCVDFERMPSLSFHLNNRKTGQCLTFSTRFFIPKNKVNINGITYINYPAYKASILHINNKLLAPGSIWAVVISLDNINSSLNKNTFQLMILNESPKKVRASFRTLNQGFFEYVNSKKLLEFHVNTEASILKDKIKRIERSWSWRITKPLRTILRKIKRRM